jgi:RNA polymerase subunit RPABC4/transcription elongation factor Spt4
MKRFVADRGCPKCRIFVPNAGDCCPKCGNVFSVLRDGIILDLVLEQEWIKIPVVWWKPTTWKGGYWRFIDKEIVK